MKILHIGKYYPPFFGGIEKVSFDLVETLNEKGFSTDVICFNHNSGSLVECDNYKIIRSSVILSSNSTPISLSFFFHLRKIYHKYDIIHLHVPNPLGAIVMQCIPFKGKIVVHWHSDIIRQRLLKKIYAPFQRRLLVRADKIIVTSQNYLNGSKDLVGFHEKCTVIPIGISRKEFVKNEKFQEELNILYKNKIVIFSVGRLIYYKGFEYLIRAGLELPDNFIILIGGIGILDDKLQKQIINLGLNNKVKLLGKIAFEELGEYFNRADVFCLTSVARSEAFGVVQIEAMSYGCPVVSTNIKDSGVPWVNKDKYSGIVVEPRNSAQIANAILEIANNPEKKLQFSRNSKKRYESHFTKEIMVNKTITLYNKLFVPMF